MGKHAIQRRTVLRRPYGQLVEGELQTVVADSIYAKAYRFATGYSILVRKLDHLLGVRRTSSNVWTSSNSRSSITERLERKSIAITLYQLREIRQLFPEIPAYMLNCRKFPSGHPLQGVWKTIGRDAGFSIISHPPFREYFQEIFKDDWKKCLNSDGEHFSNLGNIYAGQILAREFIKQGYLKDIQQSHCAVSGAARPL